ncbi:hypothetical protein Tco_0258024, partial [Tanacetum coccineum]
ESLAVAARQSGSFVACRADYSFVDTVDASIRAAEERAMAVDDRAAVRAEIEVLRRERLAYERERERESSETRQALARSKAHNRALEARIATMETQLYRLEWQRQDADDYATRAMMRIHVLKHRAHIDTLKDTGSSA